jgi:hypothetical protein
MRGHEATTVYVDEHRRIPDALLQPLHPEATRQPVKRPEPQELGNGPELGTMSIANRKRLARAARKAKREGRL